MRDKLSAAEFDRLLDETCDSLRGNREAEEFKEYVVAILFLKRLNDRFRLEREVRRNKLMEKGLSPAQIDEELEKRESYRLFVPKMARWDEVTGEQEDLGAYLSKAFREIDASNRGCLGLLNTIDFTRTTESGDRFITNNELAQLIKGFEGLILTDDHLAF
ncbi:type I restriction-modification system methyltransferase subunit [Desulfosporosinus orientis DSM 765]|uniref:site-specific DNA-methyltransferase (adenine-specific) n=1 Tax=Desulfosporosinus orientis (strain ATCC 19365 / DSM 765 / NCIMB 8382 / VKM B-1628 / Singapore I) TaxID=768706 RepID=G7W7Z5_DESOD|nr:type I restriction-modification system subunit M N-terminal domain-containing protein [Desulfosporosinus orientis]AET66421.1 type I restriction-modification system methyltransferase subunit [Desulfosporosinus orientis DSM 765]